jgi:hypothetical protein
LSARQTLFRGREQPFHRRRAVAFDRIAIVRAGYRKDSKIELRGDIAALWSKKQETLWDWFASAHPCRRAEATLASERYIRATTFAGIVNAR